MKPSDILLDLGHPVAYYSGFAQRWGPAAGVFFSQMFYWTGKQRDADGWIYRTQEEIEEDTGLSPDSQQTARKKLLAVGVLEEKRSRIEHKISYRINTDKLNEIFEGQSENLRLGNRSIPVSLKGTTETTTETTEIPVLGTEPKTIIKPSNASPVKCYDPDEPEITKRDNNIKKKDNRDPRLYTFAAEIASLCSLALGNGADGELFRAAKLLCAGVGAPNAPKELLPFFGKGGTLYREWPWNAGERLKPMDIVKHWPRLSGAIKPPEVASKKRVYAEEV
jgi:hypothetical protein